MKPRKKTERKPEEAKLRADESRAKIAREAEEAKAKAAESESQKQLMLQNGGDDGGACREAAVEGA